MDRVHREPVAEGLVRTTEFRGRRGVKLIGIGSTEIPSMTIADLVARVAGSSGCRRLRHGVQGSTVTRAAIIYYCEAVGHRDIDEILGLQTSAMDRGAG